MQRHAKRTRHEKSPTGFISWACLPQSAEADTLRRIKEKDWSQTDLANESGVSREMIGKYERGEAVPSIEAAKKIADAFGVSLDYLVGEGHNSAFDKATVNRLQDVQKLSNEEKAHVYAMLDAFLLKSNIQKNLVTK